MITSYAAKHYQSLHTRLFDSVLDRFLMQHVPQLGGPVLRKVVVDKIMELIETYSPPQGRVKPGQMVWTAVDKATRADTKKVRYKAVTLTLMSPQEVELLSQGKKRPLELLPGVVARILTEAEQQGALLSMRDIGVLFKREPSNISAIRQLYEKEHQRVLPTPATLQDMGSGITHKAMILRKILIEKKDMAIVRNETYHTQQAIDRYLKEYRRVEMLLDDNKDMSYIAQITQMPVFVIKQYRQIYHEYKNLKSTP